MVHISSANKIFNKIISYGLPKFHLLNIKIVSKPFKINANKCHHNTLTEKTHNCSS